MKRVLLLVLTGSLAIFSAIALGSATPEKGLEHRLASEEAMSSYLKCSLSYAREYASLDAAPSEIAEGALSRCDSHALAFKESSYLRAKANIPDRQARRYSEDAYQQLRSQNRGFVVDTVLEVRADSGGDSRIESQQTESEDAAPLL